MAHDLVYPVVFGECLAADFVGPAGVVYTYQNKSVLILDPSNELHPGDYICKPRPYVQYQTGSLGRLVSPSAGTRVWLGALHRARQGPRILACMLVFWQGRTGPRMFCRRMLLLRRRRRCLACLRRGRRGGLESRRRGLRRRGGRVSYCRRTVFINI